MAKKKKADGRKQGGSQAGIWITLVVLILVGVGGYFLFRPTLVEVPELLGMDRQEAVAILSDLGLTAEVRLEHSDSPKIVPGTVFGQAPAAGAEVPKRSVITLYISDLEGGITVPDVVGATRSEAEDALRRVGLEVEFIEATSSTIPIGRVISQSPGVGTPGLEKGAVVTLTISGGKGEQVVPELVELDVEFARAMLAELNLEMVVREVAEQGFVTGDPVFILRQEPSAGSRLPVGSRVTVFVPIAPPDARPPGDPGSSDLHAPRLEGLTIAQARQLAAENGVEMELADSAEDSSTVTFQEPPPGDPLSPGQTVLVRTARSSVVPGVTGLSETEARAEIEKAELVVGRVSRSYGPVEGEVLGQRPSSGIEVVAGSSVDLVISDPLLEGEDDNTLDPLPTPAFTPAPWVE